MTTDTFAVMAEVMAGVALGLARRSGAPAYVAHNGVVWTACREPRPGWEVLAVVDPWEDEMSIAKRILAARLAGQHVPRAVLALVTPVTSIAIAIAIATATTPPPESATAGDPTERRAAAACPVARQQTLF